MGNSVDEIKAIADYTTDTNQNDGVALAVEGLLL
jgi:hydroxymethylpyrimidine pyrophosphatase-like HAD family hydrolase